MENIVKEYLDKFGKEHARRHRYACLLGALALLVCLAVFWRLKLVGTAMTDEAACGLQEHTHTEDCYTDVLVCDISTEETAHVHTADCYRQELTCGLPEHTHTADCYSNAEADTETKADWTKILPLEELTGDWAQDTMLVASTQLGYTESTQNWQLGEDGTRRGYTRYGAWYGNPYGDWNGMFAAFCLKYAGVPDDCLTTKNAAGVNAWAVTLYQAGQLQGTGHEAAPGDVVFMGSDDTIESCGIVADVYEENGTAMLAVLAGDVDNAVAELTVPADSGTILGYAATADAYAAYEADHPADPAAEPADDENTATPTEPTDSENTETEETGKTEETDETENQPAAPEQPEQPPFDTLEGNAEIAVAMYPYMRTVTADSTVYDAAKNLYKTTLYMNFVVPTSDAKNNKSLYYDLPDGISIPQEEIGKNFVGKSGDKDAYTFKIVEENGKYRLELTFDDDFLSQHNSDTINSTLYYEAEVGQEKVESSGVIKVIFTDNVTLVINPNQIEYNDKESPNYDIDTTKKGSFDADTKKLRYEVTVSTVKGTADTITVKDVLSDIYGYDISDVDIVSVTKNENGVGPTTLTKGETSGNYKLELDNSESGKKAFTMILPGLARATDSTTPNTYTIVYEYTVPDNFNADNGFYPKNTVTATSKNEQTKETVTKTASTTVHVYKELLKKRGDYNNGTVTWTITVNESRNSNIAGKTLRDTMFSAGVDGKTPDNRNIKPRDIIVKIKDADGKEVKNAESYTIEIDESGNVSDIRFNGVTEDGKNYYKYEFSYSVPVTPGITASTMTNTAKIDDEEKDATATVEKASGGTPLYKGRTSATALDSEGKATISWEFKITAPAVIPQGTDVYDELVSGNGDGKHYFTLAQAQAIVDALTAQKVDGEAVVAANSICFNLRSQNNTKAESSALNNAQYESWSKIQNNPNLLSGKMLTGFTFQTAKELAKGDSFEITYSSTVDMAAIGGGDVKFANFTKYGDYTSQASQNYVKPYVKKSTLKTFGSVTAANRNDTAVVWKVTVGYDKNDASTTKYVIQDTLPAGMELKEIWLGTGESYDRADQNNQKWKYTVTDGTGSFDQIAAGNLDSAKLGFSATVEGKTVTVTVDFSNYRESFDKFFVDFACGITQEKFDSVTKGEAHWNERYTNNVTLHKEGNSWVGDTTATADISIDRQSEKVNPVTKNGVWNKETKTIAYTLKINPEGKQYQTSTGKLSLNDVLTYDTKNGDARAHLVDNSVQLYKAVQGENGELVPGDPVEDWSWTYSAASGNCTLNVDIPNATPLILVYQYKLDYAGKGDVNIWTSNTAELNGEDSTTGRDEDNRYWQKSSGGGVVQNSYDFVKVDSRDNNLRLEGAEFTLYACTNGKYQETGKTYRTDENGKFSISIGDTWGENGSGTYQPDTQYYVVETRAPDKYILSTDAPQYYFYFGGNNSAALPQEFLAKAIDLNKFSDTVYVSNTKLAQDIAVTKQWQNTAGEPLQDDLKQNVTVTLYRAAVNKSLWEKWQAGTANEQELSDARKNAELYTTATLSADNLWRKEFRALDAEADADRGLYYIYFVEETPVPGFTATVTETRTPDAGQKLYKAEIRITNTYNAAYRLPETGGSGTMPYTLGGAALMAASALYLCGKKRRQTGKRGG